MKLQNTTSTSASKVTFIILFAVILVLSFQISTSFLIPIVIGQMIAWTLKPFQQKLARFNIGRKLSSFLIFILLIFIVIIPLAFFFKSLFGQAANLKGFVSSADISFTSILQSMKQWPILKYVLGNPSEIESSIKEFLINIGSEISTYTINQAVRIPTLILQTFFLLLSTLFFLLDEERISSFFSSIIPLRKDIKMALIENIKETTKNSLWASFLVAIIQGSIMFVAYLTLSVPAPFLAASTTFVFSFIPFMGSAPVWILAAIYLYIKGSFVKVILMIIFGIITGLVDNFVRPYVLTNAKEEIHPLVALISVFGGLQVFGFFGVLIGPIIAVILIAMCRVWPQIWDE
ncbi:MAG: AI-2E family transporter [Oligoflexia bacterium]|nr:AI-2E family transporter [Oligoflexia bacterium]